MGMFCHFSLCFGLAKNSLVPGRGRGEGGAPWIWHPLRIASRGAKFDLGFCLGLKRSSSRIIFRCKLIPGGHMCPLPALALKWSSWDASSFVILFSFSFLFFLFPISPPKRYLTLVLNKDFSVCHCFIYTNRAILNRGFGTLKKLALIDRKLSEDKK